MKVVLLALSVGGAMGQYLEELVPPLSRHLDIVLFVPEHFSGNVPTKVVRFVTGNTKQQRLKKLLDPTKAYWLWKKILAERPERLYVFNGEGYPWMPFLAKLAKKQGLPLFLTLHDPEPHPGNFWESVNALIRRFVIPLSTSVHVHSSVFVPTARSLGARNVEVIPHGSFAPRFLRYAKPGVKREKDLVLFFGRFEYYKGLDVLVRAIIALQGKKRALIVGPGRMPRSLAKAVLEYPDLFEVHNRYVSDGEAAHMFQRASTLVLPYIQATQSSLPLLGAAFGLAVVATAVGAFVEDVPRIGGILVQPAQAHSLAQGLLVADASTTTYPKDLEFPALAERFARWLGGGILDH